MSDVGQLEEPACLSLLVRLGFIHGLADETSRCALTFAYLRCVKVGPSVVHRQQGFAITGEQAEAERKPLTMHDYMYTQVTLSHER